MVINACAYSVSGYDMHMTTMNLNGKTYEVVSVGATVTTLRGARGGECQLVQNVKSGRWYLTTARGMTEVKTVAA